MNRAPEARRSGILLHPSALPGRYGIGELGSDAHAWLEFLARAGQGCWQVLPLGPTGYGDSPYQCFSSFAGNPYLISLKTLAEQGLLADDSLALPSHYPASAIDYGALIPWKLHQLTQAVARYHPDAGFLAFCEQQARWLEDYALFMSLKEAQQGRAWYQWEPGLRERQPHALSQARQQHQAAIHKHKVWQYWFAQQWQQLRVHAHNLDILIIGDIPIFVAHDSADVWAQPELFQLDATGMPQAVAGVPPDYFSPEGQHWGNPLYAWEVHAAQNYAWWRQRIRKVLAWVDVIRLDHFRGFEAYWRIPADASSAAQGSWQAGPGYDFFDALVDEFGDPLPIIAEDLGVITPQVDALRTRYGLAGMKVLQFAFAGDAQHPYLPHNYPTHCVVYSGTHDNDTSRGWYRTADTEQRNALQRYLASEVRAETVAHQLIRLANSSVAQLAISPMQDVLQLDSHARLNTPSQAAGNWTWRFAWEHLPDWTADWLRHIAQLYGRYPSDATRQEA